MGRSPYLALAMIVLGARAAAADTCSDLMMNAALGTLPNTTITSATTLSGTFTPPDGGMPIQSLPSFCRVTATLKPSAVSDIKIEIWMPTNGWNGKFEGVGNGGLGGTISYTNLPNYLDHASLADAIMSGYAGASTDTGHVATDRNWVANEEKERDYGYRAIHEMTITAKAVIQKFYVRAATRSYFNGCSTGGGQALGEAQLYPDDYDGLLAGDSQNILTHTRASDVWAAQAVNNENKLTPGALSLVKAAVLNQCGGKDGGLEDGFLLKDPRQCRFSPEQLLCREGQDPATCLTAPQSKLMMKLSEGYISHTNQRILSGLWGPGALGWGGYNRVYMNDAFNASSPAGQFYAVGVLQNANLDVHTMDIDSAVALADQKFGFINHTSPDLDTFMRRGGKLIMYHGWDDPSISPMNSINYYSSVVERMRDKGHLNSIEAAMTETQKSARLFLVPGMGHCGGGPGPNTFDAIGTLDQWVNHGVAPDKIIASHVAPAYARPLCAYPHEARYNGSGARADASNWKCVSEPRP
jgi:feruloyl esterase